MKRTPTSRLTRAVLAVLTAALPLTVAAAADPGLPNRNQVSLDLASLYTKQEMDAGVYVGSEFCLGCHPDKSTWRSTKHAVALRRPLVRNSLIAGRGVVADYDRNGVDDFVQGLDFNAISSVFDPYKPNAPTLSVEGGVYYVTIGELRMRVVFTHGGTGDWKQRYVLEVPVASGGVGGVSAENYVSPVQYNEATREYVLYRPEHWYDASGNPRFTAATGAADLADANGGSFTRDCVGCHTTGIRDLGRTADGEWLYSGFTAVLFRLDDPSYFDYNRDGATDIVNIGCEACHGPGSRHILGGGDPRLIVNPDDLDTTRANEVCGQCHSRVTSTPDGTHDFPYDDDEGRGWHPGLGEPLEDFFTDAALRWPDGINSTANHQQYFDFLASGKPDFPFHPVRCSECHASHGDTDNRHLIRNVLVEGGVPIPTRNENDSLCLACHAEFGPFVDLTKRMIANFDANLAEIARVVEEHTNHPFGPEREVGLARCTTCHMPLIATSATLYDLHSHSFEAIPPEKNLAFQDQGGMPDSCSVSCHSLQVNIFELGITDDIGTWTAPFDRQSARRLRRFFGPGGIWWDTDELQSLTFKILEASAAPGEVPVKKGD